MMMPIDKARSLRRRSDRRGGAFGAVLAAAVLTAVVVITPVPVGAAAGFSDTDEGGTHEPAIEALDAMGVFAGTECEEGRFCPHDPIERWVMAVWLVRVLGDEPTGEGDSRFADVDTAEWWSPYTEQLAEREITKGCNTEPLRYCPDQNVTRAQMAAFLGRAFQLEAAPPAGFVDTAGGTHEAAIDSLAAAGITKGCDTDPLSYCPAKSVTRAQMAAFLHLALAGQNAVPEPETVQVDEDVPDVEMIDLSTGATVNLRSLVTGDKPLLFWFWSPY